MSNTQAHAHKLYQEKIYTFEWEALLPVLPKDSLMVMMLMEVILSPFKSDAMFGLRP